MGYPDAEEAANMVKEMTKGQNPGSVKILDMACGTGLVGKHLAEHGFTDVLGVDCSPKMLEYAS